MRARNRQQAVCPWQLSATVLLAGMLALSGAHHAVAADEELIVRARRSLYTQRDESVAILEKAVQQHPEEVVYWIEYFHALGVDSADSFADRASRHALALHPHHPDLLIARARLRHDGAGLEALADLANVPGYERTAERFRDLATCSMALPDADPWPVETYAVLADRLLVLGRSAAATRYVDEARKTVTGEQARPLLARRAMLAALAGDFQLAMELHRAANGTQMVMKGSYHGLADVMLTRNKPDLAITSFGGQVPTDGDSRRLLAVARSRSNDSAGALKLLDGDAMEDRLLRCRVFLAAGRVDDARALGQAIVAPMQIQMGVYLGPWTRRASEWPRALVDDYLFVVRSLNEQFPDKRPAIEETLGKGTEKPPDRPQGWSPVEPSARTIARLEEAMKSARGTELEQLRTALAEAYAQAGRYTDAANLLTTFPPTGYRDIIHRAWIQWSLLGRQAEALAASEKDYASLAAARPIIANIGGARWNRPKVSGQPWLSEDEVVKRLVAIGPAVLGDVMTQLGPSIISGEDRRPWVAVIAQLGSARDAPVLIATLDIVTRYERHSLPDQDANDRLTAAALDACLQKLTGAKPEGKDRAVAWSSWWARNATRIAFGR